MTRRVVFNEKLKKRYVRLQTTYTEITIISIMECKYLRSLSSIKRYISGLRTAMNSRMNLFLFTTVQIMLFALFNINNNALSQTKMCHPHRDNMAFRGALTDREKSEIQLTVTVLRDIANKKFSRVLVASSPCLFKRWLTLSTG